MRDFLTNCGSNRTLKEQRVIFACAIILLEFQCHWITKTYGTSLVDLNEFPRSESLHLHPMLYHFRRLVIDWYAKYARLDHQIEVRALAVLVNLIALAIVDFQFVSIEYTEQLAEGPMLAVIWF